MRSPLVLVLAAAVGVLHAAGQAVPQGGVPFTRAAAHLMRWVETFNAGERAAWERFKREHYPSQASPDPDLALREQTGGLDLLNFEEITATHAVAVLAMVIVPALTMVSTIRFRSFKTLDLQARRSSAVLVLVAIGVVLLAAEPQYSLVALAYTYLASGFIGFAWTRLHRRHDESIGETTHEHREPDTTQRGA